jgi:hypothetical protein
MSEIYVPPKLAGDDARQAKQEAVDERAAILEVDADLTPEEALTRAKLEVSGQQDPPDAEELRVNNIFLNQWQESIAKSTDAPGPLVLFAGVGLLSALCHRFFFYAPRETYLNLFLFILGQSSLGRKTTVLDMVRDYLAEVAPELILPNEFTPEGLYLCMAERNHGTVFSRELNCWLEQMLTKDYNRGLASTLGNIYDHARSLTRQTVKGGLVTIEDPVISILGAGVDEYLIERLKEIDLISGFWPRVTLIRLPHQDGQASKPPGRFTPEYHVLEKLRAINLQPGGEISFEKINPMREVYAVQLYREASELGNNNLAAGYARLEWILIKIAALLQLADYPDSKEIEPTAFNDAVTLVNYCKQHLPDFYGEHLKPSMEDKLAAWALKFVRKRDENGTAWVPYRDILQHSHADTGKLQAALGRLLATEECQQSDIPPLTKGGRPGKAYRSVQC